MEIAVLGTGMVGQALARKLVALGHSVIMGSRSAENEAATAFANETGGRNGTFADAAAAGELIIVATNGLATLEALDAAGAANLAGKVVIDVSNPLDFSNGFPPSLAPDVSNTTSLGEQVQTLFPDAKVVKTLNTVNCSIMVEPGRLSEPGDIFVSGDDTAAKQTVIGLLKDFGWSAPIDLGGIATARGTEQYLPLWVRLMGPMGGSEFNIKIVK